MMRILNDDKRNYLLLNLLKKMVDEWDIIVAWNRLNKSDNKRNEHCVK